MSLNIVLVIKNYDYSLLQISLYSPQIFLRGIFQDQDKKQAGSNTSSSTQTASKTAYELCVCEESGKLFASLDNCLSENNEGC